jgi:hypothetical protein
MSNESKVRPGQVWADMDSRSSGRTVRVVEVDATHAVVETASNGPRVYARLGRRYRIRLDRFRPTGTGYRLVSEEDA